MPEGRIVIASRASELAMCQARRVLHKIRAVRPEIQASVETYDTRGDRSQAEEVPIEELDTTGVFVKEIEVALLNGDADLAVHSYKDIPTQLPDGLAVAAVVERVDPRDAIVSRSGAGLMELPAGARVGTSSPRRKAQILAQRRDLEIVPIRGNVPTRIEKVNRGEIDACILAYAGLLRLGRDKEAAEIIELSLMLPAPAQAALAVEIRDDDAWAAELCMDLHNDDVADCVEAERALLRCLGGGCLLPLGALAILTDEDTLRMDAALGDPAGARFLRTRGTGPRDDPEALGKQLAEKFREAGADKIVRAVHR